MEQNSTSEVLFIDVGERAPVATIKEERASSPDETLSDVKNQKNSKKFQCAECKYSFKSEERMTRHIRRAHQGVNPFQCVMCDYSTYNSTLFREHVFRHQGKKPYKCRFCSYRTVSKKYIKMHEEKHEFCACGFISRNRKDLIRHQTENGCDVAAHQHRCSTCGHGYVSQQSLALHKKAGKKCQYCDKKICSIPAMKQHLSVKHGIVDNKRVKRKTYKFNCAHCAFKSSTSLAILLHLIHHPDQELDGSIDVSALVKSGILTATAEYTSAKT